MNETDVNIEFEFVKSSLERLQKTTQFCDFAFINGKWRSVATLIMLESPNYLNYLVEEAETRNKYMMKSTDMILGRREENNRIELGFNKNI